MSTIGQQNSHWGKVSKPPGEVVARYRVGVSFRVVDKRTGNELLPHSVFKVYLIEVHESVQALYMTHLLVQVRAKIEADIDESLVKGEKTYESLIGTRPKIIPTILSNTVLE